jgi:hypothetical protein
MKKNILFILLALFLAVSVSGCFEPWYHHDHHDRKGSYNGDRGRTNEQERHNDEPGVQINIH